MDFLQRLKEKPSIAFKMLGLLCVAVIIGTFLLQMIRLPLGSLLNHGGVSTGVAQIMPGYAPMAYGEKGVMADSYALNQAMPTLSIRNVAPMPPQTGGVPGDDAEAFEITDYNVTIETRRLAGVCGDITGLKGKDYVIFEQANAYDKGCNFVFKVKADHVDEVLGMLKALDPRELSQNTQTIKREVEDFTNQVDILQRKRASIDETLENAITAYDQISALATRAQDVESLAKIIDSKIAMVERLTQERIDINQQLDYLTRAKAEQLDRLAYTYFHVNVYENVYVDGDSLKDSWRNAVREFVYTVNRAAQGATLGFVAVLFVAIPFLLYLIVVLVVVKYGWRVVRRWWSK